MSHTQFTCPKCGAALKLSVPVAAGRAVRCPKCKVVFTPNAGPPPAIAVKPLPQARPVAVRRASPQPAPVRPLRPRRRDEDDREWERPNNSKAQLIGGLIGVGMVLAIVGVVLAVKFSSGDGDKKDDQREEQ